MAYRFNNGNGAVTCDECNIIIDEYLSHKDYLKNYGDKGDICWKCKKEKEACSECKGHGGTYDTNPRNGDIVGIPCEACKDKEDITKEILKDGWRN